MGIQVLTISSRPATRVADQGCNLVDVILAHCIRLAPSAEQKAYFRNASAAARFAYNLALAQWQQQHLAGKKPSEASLRKHLNAVKHEQFPWMLTVTKNAPQQAIKNLGQAYANFFHDLKKFRRCEISWKRVRVPKFKKKGRTREVFRADNGPRKGHLDTVHTDGMRVKLPVIGWVKMLEEVRFAGRILSVTIFRRADAWYASFSIETNYEPEARKELTRVGVDLGIANLATLNDGTKISAPRPLRAYQKKLRRLSRALSRKERNSNNRAKAKNKLARLHRRIANIRSDALHKVTTNLVNFASIVIEDLNVRGMRTNRHLSRAISDIGLSAFRRQLEYKSAMSGSIVIIADRWYPSSKLCSECLMKNEALTLSERTWRCPSCGTTHDRDINAAVNLARYPESWAGLACGAECAGRGQKTSVEPAA